MPAKVASKKPSLSHPKYAEMITASIPAIKDRKGASRQAIVSYLKKTYKVGDNVGVQVKLNLVRMVDAGKLNRVSGTGASGRFKLVAPKPKPAAAKGADTKKTTSKPKQKKPVAKAKPVAKKATKKPAAKKSPAKKKSAATPKQAKAAVKKASPKKKVAKKSPAKKPAAKKTKKAKK
uniref:Histone H1.0-like n=1 Tax=Phallusia mammillata TaxID=59560 RepID=A0A6F9DF40_9ASCI|nr:histone H1.0-like [Phallusia mammillata]